MAPAEQPYGTWTGPVTLDLVAGAALDFPDILVDRARERLYRLEARPAEAGRVVLIDQVSGTEISPSSKSVKSRVHEYGGAPATVSQDRAVYSVFADFDVQSVDLADGKWGESRSIVPKNEALRYADFDVHRNRDLILAVCEDHTKPAPADVLNSLVIIDASKRTVTPFATGHDFFAAPRWSADGSSVAYVAWNHPNMPWEDSMLYVVKVDEHGASQSPRRLVGGNGVSISQPRWSLDGKTVLYLSDETGYYQLYSIDTSDDGAKPRLVLPSARESDFGGPDWSLGQSSFQPIDEDTVIVSVGKGELAVVSVSRQSVHRTFVTPYRSIGAIRVVSPKQVAFVGTGASTPAALLTFDPTSDPASVEYTVVAKTTAASIDDGYISASSEYSFPAGPDPGSSTPTTAYAKLLKPRNKDFVGPKDELPPCLIRVHGGPTSAARSGLSWEVQYWTSAGWLVLDLDYGRGRDYRNRLVGNWGIVDVHDAISCAKAVVKDGLADPKRIAIQGGSAGGFTVLAALCESSATFGAGASLYGVASLKGLCDDTHKSQYLFKLVGGTPEQVPQVYHDRSPINNADKITSPLLVLQGGQDRVVPQSQAELIVKSVKERGTRCEYLLFPEEGHGFRQAANMRASIDGQMSFFNSVFGIAGK